MVNPKTRLTGGRKSLNCESAIRNSMLERYAAHGNLVEETASADERRIFRHWIFGIEVRLCSAAFGIERYLPH